MRWINRDRAKKTEWEGVCLAILAFGLAASFTRADVSADHANSRLATVYSLVHHGTFYIDTETGKPASRYAHATVDKVMVHGVCSGSGVRDGRHISSKPPLMPLIMTAEYIFLRTLFGWHLDRKEDALRIIYIMTLTFGALAYGLAVYFFYKSTGFFLDDIRVRIFMTCALALGTHLLGYATVLSNHIPAVSCMLGALYIALGMMSDHFPPTRHRLFLFGLLASAVFAFDMPVLAPVAIAGLGLLSKYHQKALTWCTLGAVPVLMVHFIVTYTVTHSFLPVQMHPELYLYPDAYWRHPRGIDALNESRLVYLFHMLIGKKGVFLLHPILLFGWVSVVVALLRRSMPWRREILAGALATLIMITYYTVNTNNYGGEAYGFRWLIGAMPVWLFMGLPLLPYVRGRFQWALLSVALIISIYSSFECLFSGWQFGNEWTWRLFVS